MGSVVALVATITLATSSAASAADPCGLSCQAARFKKSDLVPSHYMGTKVTIGNGMGSEQNVDTGDFAHSTAYADAAPTVTSLIQQGVHWRNHDPYTGGGNCTSNSLEYFVEIVHAGASTCYTEGAAAYGVQQTQEVLEDSSGIWRPYMGGYWQAGAQTSWNPCGGDACTVAAFAEEDNGDSQTTWHAKFAGSGNVQWQWWNGSYWLGISHCQTVLQTGWKGSGPFPGGIWSLIFRDGGSDPYDCP